MRKPATACAAAGGAHFTAPPDSRKKQWHYADLPFQNSGIFFGAPWKE